MLRTDPYRLDPGTDIQFNSETGNLTNRRNALKNLTETFTYNNQDQLTSWKVGSTTYSVGYKSDGTSRINTKTDAGTYVYGATPDIHQVTGINNNPGTINNSDATITYNSFNKLSEIEETGGYRQVFTYAADEQRRVSKLYNSSGSLVKETVYVPGGYEVEKRGTNTRRLHYIPVGDCWALYTKNSAGADSTYFLLTDHLGSVHVITNAGGAALKEYSFDPWGRRRNPNNWTYNSVPAVSITNRGFTMHEHMDQFKLINMNGRVYDPVLGQFLSPDPFISDPTSTMGYNRYAYCYFNPLKYIDPTGYLTQAEFSDIVDDLWNSPYGGSWSRGGGITYFGSSGEAYAAGQAYMSGYGGGSYQPSYSLQVSFRGSEISLLPKPRGLIEQKWSWKPIFRINMQVSLVQNGYVFVPYNSFSNNESLNGNENNSPAGGGDGTPGWISWANFTATTGAYAAGEAGGSFRMTKGGSLSIKHYASAWTGGSRARITTYSLTKLGTRVGYGTVGVGIITSGINFAMSDKSWGDYGQLGISLLSTGLTLSGPTAPIGIGIGLFDLTGGFNGFYNYLDSQQQFYNSTGGVIVPLNGLPTFIPLRRP